MSTGKVNAGGNLVIDGLSSHSQRIRIHFVTSKTFLGGGGGGTVGVGSRDIFIPCTKCKLNLSLGRTHRKLSRLESGRKPQSWTSLLDC